MASEYIVTNTARVGYSPDIRQPIGKVTLSLGDFKPPTDPGGTSPEDAEKIQEFLENFTETRDRLAELDLQLEKFLTTPQNLGDNGLPTTFSITYDPDALPELAEAHHHICGSPGSRNVITYQDIKARSAVARVQMRAAAAIPETLEEMANMGAKDLHEKMSKQVQKQIAQMLDAVWRQIIIWVLEVVYKSVKPLESVKFVKALPKLIKRAIDRLRRNSKENPISFQAGEDVTVSEEGEISAEDLAKAGGGYTASLKELAQDLPPECLQHTASWNRIVDSLVRDGPYASAYYAKKVSEGMLGRMDSLNKVAALGIPNGTAFTVKGTALTYTNPLPEEYLQARADGSTRFGALSTGLMDSVNQVKNTAIPKLERLVRQLVADPNVLCCLLRNLIAMVTVGKDLKKALLTIQALLQVWRNLHSLDISKEVARLGNMIVDLLNQLLQSIFSMFNSLFNNFLYKNVMGVMDLKKLIRDTQCAPWNELINMAVEIADEMLQKVLGYLSGFFLQFRLDIQFSGRALDEITRMAQIDRYLELINKILRFSAAWAACVESERDKSRVTSGSSRLTVNPRGVTLAPLAATTNRTGTALTTSSVTTGQGSSSRAGASIEGTSSESGTFSDSGALSEDSVRVLLTNFLGVDDERATAIIGGTDDCRCDNALSPSELADIERAIKEKGQ